MKIANLVESKINKHRGGIHIFWWRPKDRSKRNFGDEVTPAIIEKLWGRTCRWTRVADCDMVGAGSILEIVNTYNPPGHSVHVWGSGFIEKSHQPINNDLVFDLVRGPLTAARVSSETATPQGDPGLLASRAFTRSGTVTHKVGVIPHMKDLDTEEFQALTKHCFIISPYQSPEKVAQDITSCETIFSSSLHGLIFADSFSVPNFRLKHTTLEGGDYKFNDYYQSTNRSPSAYSLEEVHTMIDLDQELNSVRRSYVGIQNLQEMQDTIQKAFPFENTTG